MDFHTWLWSYDNRWFFNIKIVSFTKIWYYIFFLKLLKFNSG